MIPMQYHEFARQIYQERIQAAQSPRPEWPGVRIRLVAKLAARPDLHSSFRADLPAAFVSRIAILLRDGCVGLMGG
jgi:hypothetical protein